MKFWHYVFLLYIKTSSIITHGAVNSFSKSKCTQPERDLQDGRGVRHGYHLPTHKYIKNTSTGLSWWHGGCESACQCGGRGFGPWSGRIPHAAEQLGPCATTAGPTLWSPWATAVEPLCRSCWGPRAWSQCSAAREATAMRSLHTATKSGPHSTQLEKSLCAATRIQHNQK